MVKSTKPNLVIPAGSARIQVPRMEKIERLKVE